MSNGSSPASAGRDPGPGTGSSPGPINFDTIEGSCAPRPTRKPRAPGGQPGNRHGGGGAAPRTTRTWILVDEFWRYKDLVYRFIINAESGLLADAVCQSFMRRRLERFSAGDFYATEAALFRKLCRACAPC